MTTTPLPETDLVVDLVVDGDLYRPGDDGYAAQLGGYNRIVEHHPEVVVVARHAGDVQAAVRFAAEQGMSVAVQATGHGVSRPADGVLVRTHELTGIDVDPVARTARVEAGVRGGELVARAADHGLLPLGGSSPDVGVIGYHLGGGIALLGRSRGYAAERVRSLEVVTADGELRLVTPETHPDLFWAMLGCRGNFGVVVAMTVELLPITSVVGGGLWFTGPQLDDAVRAYLDWTTTVPGSTCSSVLLMRLPDVDGVPEPVRGQRIAHVRVVDDGDPTAALERVAQLRATTPSPAMDTVAAMPARALGTVHAEPSGPTTFEARNGVLGDLDADAVDVLLGHAGADGDDRYLVELRHLGGALGPSGSDRVVVGRRDGAYLLYSGSTLGALTRDEAADAQDTLHRAMTPWSTGSVTPAFLSGEHVGTDTLRSGYHPDDWQRLRAVKADWDPDNLFRVNQNVPPRSS